MTSITGEQAVKALMIIEQRVTRRMLAQLMDVPLTDLGPVIAEISSKEFAAHSESEILSLVQRMESIQEEGARLYDEAH